MTRARVLILVEEQYRDLPGCALVKYHLQAGYGARVRIDRDSNGEAAGREFRPHVAVLPDLFSKPRRRLANELRDQGAKVAVLPVRSWWGAANLRVMFDRGGVAPDPDIADRVFVQTERAADVAIDAGATRPDAVDVTGVPRFDVYREHGFHDQFTRGYVALRLGMDPTLPLLVWTSPFRVVPETDSSIFSSAGPGTPESAIRDMGSDMREIRTSMERLLALLRRLPDVNLLVKIYATDSIEPYLSFVEYHGLDNVRVVGAAYIQPILLAADVHLHQYSVTTAESWMAGRPTLLLPFGFHRFVPYRDLLRCSEAPETVDEIAKRARYYMDGGAVASDLLESRCELLERTWGRQDGNAATRVAKGVWDLLDRDQRSIPPGRAPGLTTCEDRSDHEAERLAFPDDGDDDGGGVAQWTGACDRVYAA